MSRKVLLLAHPGRPEARELAIEAAAQLADAGLEAHIAPEPGVHSRPLDLAGDGPIAAGCELVCVLGGDGTILRGAEVARDADVPLLGVNLGHVGFLAEVEREDLSTAVKRIVDRDYTIQDRMTLDVQAVLGGDVIGRSWALNEVTVEKTARERMLEVTVEIDDRPLSTWGCDGVIIATPTGSTAYAFSAGGPVIWPDVEAILLVPNSAHALFARPLVVGPASRLAVEVIADYEGSGVMWCDGRRHLDLPPGARIEVCRSPRPVRLARLRTEPFPDRLVEKFDLSVAGWRGRQ